MTKNLILLITMLMAQQASAQSIVGKWKCAKGSMDSIGQQYKYLRGYCKFKKDGTFVVKLQNKRMEPIRSYSISIKVSGTYSMADGRLSTKVASKGTYCKVNNTAENPYIDGKEPDMRDLYRTDRALNIYTRRFDALQDQMALQEELRDKELIDDWTWSNETVTLNKGTLCIGNKARLKGK